MTRRELDKCMRQMDVDGNGTVDFDEFAALLRFEPRLTTNQSFW